MLYRSLPLGIAAVGDVTLHWKLMRGLDVILRLLKMEKIDPNLT